MIVKLTLSSTTSFRAQASEAVGADEPPYQWPVHRTSPPIVRRVA
jgi:hypothetical protein